MSADRFPYSLSVFYPAYNDAKSLPGLLADTFAVLAAHVDDYEVIVVNDGSQDETPVVLAVALAAYGERLRVVQHARNRGYGGALQSGFAAATKDYVFYTDGDAQYDVRELPLLLKEAREGATWVNGYKRQRSDPWHRIVLGAAYRETAKLLFGLKLRDIDCDFRLIRRSAMEGLTLRSASGTICAELVWGLERKGLRAIELPVTHRARQHGQSQFFRIASLWKTLKELGRLVRLRLQGFGSA
jgi:glycosyltransferase involved in cell wall biosynthesis